MKIRQGVALYIAVRYVGIGTQPIKVNGNARILCQTAKL